MHDSRQERPGLVPDSLGGLSFQVIGLAMAVHNDLGPGHRESTYYNAMHQRFADAGLDAEREPELPIYDENDNLVNFYRPDHRVGADLLVEYKAHRYPLTNDEIAQCIDYFAGSDCSVLLLFNFGRRRLEWKRLFPPNDIQEHREKRRQRMGNEETNPLPPQHQPIRSFVMDSLTALCSAQDRLPIPSSAAPSHPSH